jgi:hypothetical protein
MEGLYLDCGRRRPQLKRNPLGGADGMTFPAESEYPPEMTQRPLLRTVAASWLAILGACGPDIIVDDWGAPAGFGALQGIIRQASNLPASGTRVGVAMCNPPLGSGEGISDGQGRYRVEVSLPPAGLFPPEAVDTLRLYCTVFVGPRGNPTLTDTITLAFAFTREAVVPRVRDFTLP